MRLRSRAGTLLSVLLVLAVAALLAAQLTGRWDAQAPGATTTPRPVPAARTPPPGPTLGVTTLALARNAFRPWKERDLAEINAFEQHARRHADTVMWFADWAHNANFDARQAAAVAARGSVPEVTWEPWNASIRVRVAQPRYRLARIVAGDHDRYVRRWARQVAAYGRPVRLRFGHEMNARAYPWAERTNGNRRGEFVQAWRHVHAIFAEAGAVNVTWIWSPVAGTVDPGQYPGSDQVDVIGVSGFNGGAVFRGRWKPFAVSFGPTLSFVHALDPSKPVELSEIASTEKGGSKAEWIRGLFREVRRRPYIRSIVWFNLRKEADWRIESSASSRRAFAAGINGTGRSGPGR